MQRTMNRSSRTAKEMVGLGNRYTVMRHKDLQKAAYRITGSGGLKPAAVVVVLDADAVFAAAAAEITLAGNPAPDFGDEAPAIDDGATAPETLEAEFPEAVGPARVTPLSTAVNAAVKISDTVWTLNSVVNNCASRTNRVKPAKDNPSGPLWLMLP